jgi:RNA polymerase sigma factor (sigma-70 family)
MSEKVSKLLGKYKFYKQALKGFERLLAVNEIEDRYMSAAACRTVQYSDTPIGRGSGSNPPFLTGEWDLQSRLEYEEYSYIVKRIDGALEALNEEERSVIQLKWFHGLFLNEIATRKNLSQRQVERIHTRAMRQLDLCLKFDKVPKYYIHA